MNARPFTVTGVRTTLAPSTIGSLEAAAVGGLDDAVATGVGDAGGHEVGGGIARDAHAATVRVHASTAVFANRGTRTLSWANRAVA